MNTILIKIPRTSFDEMDENIEKGLRYIGKAMQCIDSLKRENNMNERMGMRGDYGYRYPVMGGMRDYRHMDMRDEYDDDDDYDRTMGMRRMRDSHGRYM